MGQIDNNIFSIDKNKIGIENTAKGKVFNKITKKSEIDNIIYF